MQAMTGPILSLFSASYYLGQALIERANPGLLTNLFRFILSAFHGGGLRIPILNKRSKLEDQPPRQSGVAKYSLTTTCYCIIFLTMLGRVGMAFCVLTCTCNQYVCWLVQLGWARVASGLPAGNKKAHLAIVNGRWGTSLSQLLWVWKIQVAWFHFHFQWIERRLQLLMFKFTPNCVLHEKSKEKRRKTMNAEEVIIPPDSMVEVHEYLQHARREGRGHYLIPYPFYLIVEEMELKASFVFEYQNGLSWVAEAEQEYEMLTEQ